MDWETIIAWLSQGASIVTSVTVIGGGVWWMMQHFYLKPREEKRDKEHKELISTIEKTSEPHVETLSELVEVARVSALRHDQAEKRLDDHESLLDEHGKEIKDYGTRIYRLETGEGTTKIEYKEEYGGKINDRRINE